MSQVQKKPRPKKLPMIAFLILDLLLPSSDRMYLLGDYEEIYLSKLDGSDCVEAVKKKRWSANLWLWGQILRAIFIYGVDKMFEGIAMTRNYFKITYRNIAKSKLYSVINIGGLAIGIATCLVIISFINYELSYDSFHKNKDSIYRLTIEGVVGERILNVPYTPVPMGPTLAEEVPEVEMFTRVQSYGQQLVHHEDESQFVDNFSFVDKDFFNIFSYNLISGDPNTVLERPNTAVITKKTAEKFFGIENPIGKLIRRSLDEYTVTGVVDLSGQNSHLSFDVLASMESYFQMQPDQRDRWMGWNIAAYIKILDGTEPKIIEEKVDMIQDKYIGEALTGLGATVDNYLEPVESIYLHSKMEKDNGPRSDIGYIYAFSAIASFILLIACINFMNLSTARASKRAKEVGVRKVMGAFKGQLARQFMGESMIFTFAALLLALGLVELSLPWFSSIAQKELTFSITEMPWLLGVLAALGITVGLISGSYPALLLSNFKPVAVLKGNLSQGKGNSKFRSIMVVGQFAISITLIIGSLIVSSQIDYLFTKDLGFDKEELMAIRMRNIEANRIVPLKNELTAISNVLSASASQGYPGDPNIYTDVFYPEGFGPQVSFMMERISIDPDYLDTFGIELVAGRPFSYEIKSDTLGAVLINETAVKKFGWDDPVGKIIHELQSPDPTDKRASVVIGVVKDFHLDGLLNQIEPMNLAFGINEFRYITLKVNSTNLNETIQEVEKVWKTFESIYPFDYTFVNETFDNSYSNVIRLGSIFNVFTMLAVFIGCLGLFGLASFTAEERTKEIGIRKVLGSSITEIIVLLCRDFLKLVLYSNIVAWPIAYYFMENWLSNFPYHIDLGVGSFVLSSLMAVSVALLTVVYQSVKAAVSNPIKALRYE